MSTLLVWFKKYQNVPHVLEKLFFSQFVRVPSCADPLCAVAVAVTNSEASATLVTAHILIPLISVLLYFDFVL